MKEKIHTGKFNTGAYAEPESTEPIDKFTNRPKMKNSGLKDHLMEALSPHKAVVPRDNHHGFTPSKHPTGAFGRVARTGAGRGVYSYGGNVHSAKPANAVGSPPNRKGDNAVGHAPNRKGSNAIGNPPNRYGENALASRFVPRSGGRQP